MRLRTRLVIGALVLAVAFVVLGMTSPRVVPRLAVLPAPPSRHYRVECNDHFDSWKRAGLIWKQEYFSTAVGCLNAS